MNPNWTGKLQVTLIFAYISWKKFCSHTLKASSEEVIVMASWKMKAKHMKEDMWKRFFRKLAGWHLATSLWINLFTDNFPGFWARRKFSRVARYSLKFTRCEILSLLIVEVARYKKSLVTHNYSLLVAKFACYLLQKLLVAKNHPSLDKTIRGITFHLLLVTFWNSLVARYSL